jgi:hypothetical protein
VSNTILITEAGKAVPWTKPEDLPFGPDKPLPELGALFSKHFNLVLADGTARNVHKGIHETTLRTVITRNGGELGPDDW